MIGDCARPGIYDHAEWRAFERAMLTNPDDRTTQLVYADWLDENGEPEYADAIRGEGFATIIGLAVACKATPYGAWLVTREPAPRKGGKKK